LFNLPIPMRCAFELEFHNKFLTEFIIARCNQELARDR
jgi:hypothetical protein